VQHIDGAGLAVVRRMAYKTRTVQERIMAERNPALRQQAIHAAVARILAGHGIAGLTVRKVAAEAGVSPALVQHHLGTKAQMLALALAIDAERQLAGAQRGRARRHGSLDEQVAGLLAGLLLRDLEPGRRAMVQAARAASWSWDADAELRVQALLRRTLEPLRPLLHEAVAEGRLAAGETETLLELLVAAYGHVLRHGLVLLDADAAERELRRLVRFLLRPARAPAAPPG
jgi:AcrR family transcriptional regulator